MPSPRKIADDLRQNLGLAAGDIIAVHSSMKSLGRVEGGPTALIEALIGAVGGVETGTVLMPCFNLPDDVVDLRSTPCRLGLVPETFRQYPGVIRSVNHTHSVAALGRYAREITATHRGRAPLGPDSPFHELAKRGGYIVHLGCHMDSSSIIHVAEALAEVPYLDIPYPDYDKIIRLVVDETESFLCPPAKNPGCSHNFRRVEEELERRGLLTHGRVGEATSFKVSGSSVLEVAVEMLRKDPGALLCDDAGCPVCPRKKRLVVRPT